MPTAEVDRRSLARLIRRISRVNKGVDAEGTFTLRAGELQVDWGNGGEIIDAVCDEDAQCHLAGRYMRKLPAVLRGPGQVKVEVRDGRLYFDRFSIDAFIERNPRAPLLPASPRHVDFLLLPLRHDAEVIEEAGLSAEVDFARERYAATVTAVARKLRWLEVGEAEIKRFLGERLQKRAEGQGALPLSEGGAAPASDEQFSLFE